MYTAHFRLREFPFGITPDTGFFFSWASCQEALNTLLIAVRNGEGFIKITGEVGTGKTLLCRKFMAALGPDFVTAYIPNPYLEPRALMLALAEELEIEIEKDIEQHHLLKAITRRLLLLAREGKRVVLCVDEAQAMPLETLEAVRLLTNLETEKRKLLQIVMFGQPELDAKLKQDSIRQLTQRITFHYELEPLTKKDLALYIAHRLAVAGRDESLFDDGALRMLHSASGGVPRLANILSHKALLAAYGEGASEVRSRHIRAAARDTIATRRTWWPWMTAASLFIVACFSIGWVYLK
jgi:MSHA biogenesis protein MshM